MHRPTARKSKLAPPEFEGAKLSPHDRRRLNDGLRRRRPDLAVAIVHPPGDLPAHLAVVVLPRGTAGKAPQRGVHVPLSAAKAIVANTRIHGRTVKGPKFSRASIKRRDRK